MDRRTLLGSAAALGLAACSSGPGTPSGATSAGAGSGSSGPASIRLVWWGSDDRQQKTRDAVTLFMQQNPAIKVGVEPVAYDGYFDKLATQIAGGDAPDVMQLAIELVRDYVKRKAIQPLTGLNVDRLDPGTTKQGQFDQKQYVVASGLATTSVIANPALFAKAGVSMPNDKTWTWDDYLRISAELTQKLGTGFYGSGPLLNDWNLFGAFIRQQGEGAQLFTEDGTKIGFTPTMATAFFEYVKALGDAKATPPSAEQFEEVTKGVEQSGVAQNRHVMGFLPSSQFQAAAKASGQGIKPLRLPSKDGTAKGAKMAIGPAQMWGIYAKSKYPAAAVKLLDFLVNDPKAGEILLVSRGSAPNADVRKAIEPKLDPSEATISAFISEITPDTVGNPLPPAGTSNVQDILRRKVSDFLFGKTTAEAAAKSLVDEINSQIKA